MLHQPSRVPLGKQGEEQILQRMRRVTIPPCLEVRLQLAGKLGLRGPQPRELRLHSDS
jgi:hypothetical protein